MFLIADAGYPSKAAGSEPLEFPLHRTAPGAGAAEDLGSEERPLRIAVQHAEYALLCAREERIRKRRRMTRTHNRYDRTQFGYALQPRARGLSTPAGSGRFARPTARCRPSDSGRGGIRRL